MEAQVKKGNTPSWKPSAELGDIKGIDKERYKGRWCRNDERNIDKKLQEGWAFINATTNPSAVRDAGSKNEKGIDGALQYREMVAMQLPQTDEFCESGKEGQSVESRTEYLAKKNRDQIRSTIMMKNKEQGLEANPQFTPQLTLE